VNVLKTTAPVGAAVALHAPAALGEAALTAVLIDMLPGLAEGPEARLRDALERPDEPGSDRAVLHWLRAFLDKADPGHMWGGLRLVLTPEGHYLWLCEEHAREFAPGPLAPK